MTERLTLTVDEAAKMLGIGRNQAYDAARRGELPVLKIGKRLLVVRQGLEKLLGQQEKEPDTPEDEVGPAIAESDKVPSPSEKIADGQVIELPEIHEAVASEEPKVPRADSDGLLNYRYIIENAAKFSRVAAVYFLIAKDEIVYIGQSRDVYSRLLVHWTEGQKRFSRVFLVHCEPSELDALERAYIKKFQPKYNKIHNLIKEARH